MSHGRRIGNRFVRQCPLSTNGHRLCYRSDALNKPSITQIKSATPHWDDLFAKMFSGDDLCDFDAVVLVDQPGVRAASYNHSAAATLIFHTVTRVRPALPLASVLRRDAPPRFSLHCSAALRALLTPRQRPAGPRGPSDATLRRTTPFISGRCGPREPRTQLRKARPMPVHAGCHRSCGRTQALRRWAWCVHHTLSPEADWVLICITQRPASRASSRGSNALFHDTSSFSRAHGARTIPLLSPHPRPRHQLGASSRATNCSPPRSSPVCFSPFSCSFPLSSLASTHSRASSRPSAFMRPRVTVRMRRRISEGARQCDVVLIA